jgi:alanine-synthesizing transaminase
MSTLSHRDDDFTVRLERARQAGRTLLDLTESDPSRCGLGWNSTELEGILRSLQAAIRVPQPRGVREAREAVSSYLAGRGASVDPNRVVLVSSRERAYEVLLKLLCGRDDEVLVASPSRFFLELLADAVSVRVREYRLVYDGDWRLDRKLLAKMITSRTRAIVVGNPSDPTGANLSRDELSFLEDMCRASGIALIGDEGFSDTAPAGCVSVAEVKTCLAFHVSGLSGVCGLPQLHAEWIAGAGPDALVEPALARLERLVEIDTSGSSAAEQLAIPGLLARRERFLMPLRARLANNRSSLAAAALREAPWTLQWGRGGCWAVLQIGAAEAEEPLCIALLEDGVVVQPGFFHGFPRNGFLVVSLLPTPAVFGAGLARLDKRLRGPLLG